MCCSADFTNERELTMTLRYIHLRNHQNARSDMMVYQIWIILMNTKLKGFSGEAFSYQDRSACLILPPLLPWYVLRIMWRVNGVVLIRTFSTPGFVCISCEAIRARRVRISMNWPPRRRPAIRIQIFWCTTITHNGASNLTDAVTEQSVSSSQSVRENKVIGLGFQTIRSSEKSVLRDRAQAFQCLMSRRISSVNTSTVWLVNWA